MKFLHIILISLLLQDVLRASLELCYSTWYNRLSFLLFLSFVDSHFHIYSRNRTLFKKFFFHANPGNNLGASTLVSFPSVPTNGGNADSEDELTDLPTSGAAWDNLRATAYGLWGKPNLKIRITNRDETLAGALVLHAQVILRRTKS